MKSARNAILNGAIKLFSEKGYSGTSIREICQCAGVTKPVLYYHFRSKEHLYQEVMLDIFNQTRKNLLCFSDYRGTVRDLLVSYVAAEFRNSRNDPSKVRLLFRMMFSPEGEYPTFNFVEEFKRERKTISDFIANHSSGKCRDPEFVTTALMGMMLIEILEYLFTGRRTLTRQKAERLVDLLLPFSVSPSGSIPDGIEGEESNESSKNSGSNGNRRRLSAEARRRSG